MTEDCQGLSPAPPSGPSLLCRGLMSSYLGEGFLNTTLILQETRAELEVKLPPPAVLLAGSFCAASPVSIPHWPAIAQAGHRHQPAKSTLRGGGSWLLAAPPPRLSQLESYY